jgi:hypothetical protein
MSKRKIDENVTEARIARTKRSKKAEEFPAETAPAQGIETEGETKTEDSKKGKAKKAAAKVKTEPKPKPSREELVVFAFRLTEAERALIHKAAGPAKASRYVRALAIAASKGDNTAVKEILEAVRQNQA